MTRLDRRGAFYLTCIWPVALGQPQCIVRPNLPVPTDGCEGWQPKRSPLRRPSGSSSSKTTR
jgi:hypothetical protein